MTDIVDELDSREALRFLSLFLASAGSPHEAIGFPTATAAFEEIAIKLGTKVSTVKNTRDEFDRHTNSERVGWDRPLRKSLQDTFDKYSRVSHIHFVETCRDILGREWPPINDNKKEGEDQMDTDDTLEDIFGISQEIDYPIQILKPTFDASIIFSNTSPKWFALTATQLCTCLQDIRNNIDKFTANSSYEEKTWRDLFAKFLTDDVAQCMSTVQTLPLFEVLSKIIHYSNYQTKRTPRKIELTAEAIDRAISRLDALTARANLPAAVTTTKATALTAAGMGHNTIYYGAPGTGKSHTVDELVGKANAIRTVFHPDLQNSDFLGCLKPRNESGKTIYAFAPGPFCRAIRGALLDPKHQHFLIIEELNRAPAATVFGELFQLLDRDDSGRSKYDVDFPNPESREWMLSDGGPSVEKLYIPANLSIIATMNSADQGVYPLDTAFRRRWDQKYVPIIYEDGPEGNFEYTGKDGPTRSISWRKFVELLNSRLKESAHIAEDRLLGQWFVKKSELDAKVPTKILLYLWDDLLRHEGREFVFDTSKIKTYGDINAQEKAGKPIFSTVFLDSLDGFSAVKETTAILTNPAMLEDDTKN